MSTPYRLKKTISSSHNTDPDDVWSTKQTLEMNGYYSKPPHGMTEYPDQQLIDSIKQFQKKNKLRVDGVMRPGGETENALLQNPKLAATLWCRICGAPHGGVYSVSICWQCWNKGLR